MGKLMGIQNRGAVPWVLIGIVALILAVGGGGFFFYQSLKNKPIELNEEEQEIYNQATQDLASFIEDVQKAKGEKEVDVQEDLEQKLEEFKKEVARKASEILAKNPCDATMGDIEFALKTAVDAQQVGNLDLSDQLFEWARKAFRSLVSELTLSFGWSFAETGFDPIDAYTPEERRQMDYWRGQNEILYNRATLAQQAQQLGFEDLHNDILSGKYIQPACVTFYDIIVDADYEYGDGFSYNEDWTATARIEDVPIYKADDKIGLPALHKSHKQQATISHQDLWWSDDSYDAPYHCRLQKMEWQVTIDYISQKNLWDEKLALGFHLVPAGSTPYFSADCDDGGGMGVLGADVFRTGKIEISMIEVWKMEPFTIEQEVASDERQGKMILRFTPKKRVSIEDFLKAIN